MIAVVIGYLTLFTFFCVLAAVISSVKRRKGRKAELELDRLLRATLDPKLYRVLHNVTLPRQPRDGTSQIDHIVISQWGVFVIETKDWFGWIFGSEGDDNWTVRYPTGKKSYPQNPIKQNRQHIESLAGCLGLPSCYFRSIVAFTLRSDFKTPLPDYVVRTDAVPGYIRRQQRPDVLVPADALRIVENVIREWTRTLPWWRRIWPSKSRKKRRFPRQYTN